jgi:hypothetical protein
MTVALAAITCSGTFLFLFIWLQVLLATKTCNLMNFVRTYALPRALAKCCLRQSGASCFSLLVFALAERKNQQPEDETYHAAGSPEPVEGQAMPHLVRV